MATASVRRDDALLVWRLEAPVEPQERSEKKSYRPDTNPYTLWAETDAGKTQVGCTQYSLRNTAALRQRPVRNPLRSWELAGQIT